jgi:hypothetical protein
VDTFNLIGTNLTDSNLIYNHPVGCNDSRFVNINVPTVSKIINNATETMLILDAALPMAVDEMYFELTTSSSTTDPLAVKQNFLITFKPNFNTAFMELNVQKPKTIYDASKFFKGNMNLPVNNATRGVFVFYLKENQLTLMYQGNNMTSPLIQFFDIQSYLEFRNPVMSSITGTLNTNINPAQIFNLKIYSTDYPIVELPSIETARLLLTAPNTDPIASFPQVNISDLVYNYADKGVYRSQPILLSETNLPALSSNIKTTTIVTEVTVPRLNDDEVSLKIYIPNNVSGDLIYLQISMLANVAYVVFSVDSSNKDMIMQNSFIANIPLAASCVLYFVFTANQLQCIYKSDKMMVPKSVNVATTVRTAPVITSFSAQMKSKLANGYKIDNFQIYNTQE